MEDGGLEEGLRGWAYLFSSTMNDIVAILSGGIACSRSVSWHFVCGFEVA